MFLIKNMQLTAGNASGCFFWPRGNSQAFSLMFGERSFLSLFCNSRTPLDSIRDKLFTLIYFVLVQCPSVGATWHSARCARNGWTSEEAKIYCNNLNSSNAVVCSHLILAYTVRLAMINAAELERNGCFSLPLLRNVVLWWKRTSIKSLKNRISYQIWYKRCLKRKLDRRR